jgi:hypothetical protein
MRQVTSHTDSRMYEMTLADYMKSRVTSYTGSSTWLALDGRTYVAPCFRPIDMLIRLQKGYTIVVNEYVSANKG